MYTYGTFVVTLPSVMALVSPSAQSAVQVWVMPTLPFTQRRFRFPEYLLPRDEQSLTWFVPNLLEKYM